MEKQETVVIELTQEEYNILYDMLSFESKRTQLGIIDAKGDLSRDILNKRLGKLNKLTDKFTE